MPEPRRRGRPPGSTNKPLVQRQEARGDERIAKALPDLMDVLIRAAVEEGNTSVAIYLINRVLGRPTEHKTIESKEEQRIIIEEKSDWRS